MGRRRHRVRPLDMALASVLLMGVLTGSNAGRTGATQAQAPMRRAQVTATPKPTPTATPTATLTAAQVRSNLASVRLGLAPFTSGLLHPTFLTHADDGSGRVYILEQGGRIWVVEANGQRHTTPFLDLRAVVREDDEMGLLGMAFHPQYKTNGLFFVAYSNHDGNTVIARYRADLEDPLRADAASARVILLIKETGIPEHKSGMLLFGQDGYLYIGVGDGGQGAPSANGQRMDTLLGKILRIDVNRTSAGKAYAIPPNNPFIGKPGVPGEIWAYGVRNPWRFSADRATGDLYIGDVGAGAFEEIDYQPASSHGGTNYGWDVYEGNVCGQRSCALPAYAGPVAVFQHTGGMCAVVGGYVYRGTSYPALAGIYLFADWCTGRIFGLVAAGNAAGKQAQYRQVFEKKQPLPSFGEDEAGELYVLSYYEGKVYHVTAA